MVESELVTLVSQFGFPIALSIYLLLTRDKVISKNTEALQALKETIENNKKN